MAEMALERSLFIHSSCIWRWVQIYGRELDKRCRAHLSKRNCWSGTMFRRSIRSYKGARDALVQRVEKLLGSLLANPKYMARANG